GLGQAPSTPGAVALGARAHRLPEAPDMVGSGTSIQNVSDTAVWVAMYRAYESERPDAHFHDPYARRLAGPNGEAIVRSIPRGRATSWPMVVRTVVFDEFVRRAVLDEGADTVLNLASGLD